MKARRLADNETRTFAIVMDSGDEVVATLEAWAREHRIGGATVSAIGAFQSVVFGYFELSTKRYREIPISEQVELISLLGVIAHDDQQPQLHAQAVVADSEGVARAGHLISGLVHPTLEVVITDVPVYLRRRTDPETGLPLLDLD